MYKWKHKCLFDVILLIMICIWTLKARIYVIIT